MDLPTGRCCGIIDVTGQKVNHRDLREVTRQGPVKREPFRPAVKLATPLLRCVPLIVVQQALVDTFRQAVAVARLDVNG